MKQAEADAELGRIVRESLAKAIANDAAWEVEVAMDVPEAGERLAVIRVTPIARK